jgi:hypothetical protein
LASRPTVGGDFLQVHAVASNWNLKCLQENMFVAKVHNIQKKIDSKIYRILSHMLLTCHGAGTAQSV